MRLVNISACVCVSDREISAKSVNEMSPTRTHTLRHTHSVCRGKSRCAVIWPSGRGGRCVFLRQTSPHLPTIPPFLQALVLLVVLLFPFPSLHIQSSHSSREWSCCPADGMTEENKHLLFLSTWCDFLHKQSQVFVSASPNLLKLNFSTRPSKGAGTCFQAQRACDFVTTQRARGQVDTSCVHCVKWMVGWLCFSISGGKENSKDVKSGIMCELLKNAARVSFSWQKELTILKDALCCFG